MKSVNILMTDSMRDAVDGGGTENSRSARVRAMMAAILAANRSGDDSAFAMAVEKAELSAWRIRHMIEEAELGTWRKGIVWMPMSMHSKLEKLLTGTGLLVSDLVRGAVIGACEYPIEDMANKAGMIVWERNLATVAAEEAAEGEASVEGEAAAKGDPDADTGMPPLSAQSGVHAANATAALAAATGERSGQD